MTLHELGPRFKIGNVEFGKKPIREATSPAYMYTEPHKIGLTTEVHQLIVVNINPDFVRVKSNLHGRVCLECFKRSGIIPREDINDRLGLKEILRWTPSR